MGSPTTPAADSPSGEESAANIDLALSDDELLDRLRTVKREEPLAGIGGFEILSVAGRGGQGTVFRARQHSTGRIVALKRVHTGLQEGSTWRFEREIEVQLSLRHPNIVTVLALEEVDDQPLLVLEWIDGVHLDRWTHPDGPLAPGRGVRSVLTLLLKVCDALTHAHQRGVIHRDLKPSNILVDVRGEPRVLDFGLAKFLDRGPGSPQTQSAFFLGTLAYAAPEQLRDPRHLDVRTDVYALGSLLHQCLTGGPPFGAADDIEAATRAICSEDPAPPSRRNAAVHADLDAIVARALAKEPERRYSSVEALAADLRSHLAGEPVVARPPTTLYLLRRFFRRHRSVAVGASIGLSCLVAGAGTATWHALRASEFARDATAINDVLLDLLRAADPFQAGRRLAEPELLDAAAANLRVHLKGNPRRAAAVHLAFGKAYRCHGRFASAEEHLRASLDFYRGALGEEALSTLEAWHELGFALRHQGRLKEARESFTRAAQGRELALGREAWETLVSQCQLGMVLHDLGEHQEAEHLVRRAAEGLERLGAHDLDALFASNMLSFVVAWRGRYGVALEISAAAAERARSLLEPGHPLLLGILSNQAYQLFELGRLDEAEALSREVRRLSVPL